MPEEIMIIVIVSIVFGSLVTMLKTFLAYRERTRFGGQRQRQVEATSSAEGASLTTSELREMMREAVAEAAAPLQDRLDSLERKVDSPAGEPLLRDAMEPVEPGPARTKTVGGRTQ